MKKRPHALWLVGASLMFFAAVAVIAFHGKLSQFARGVIGRMTGFDSPLGFGPDSGDPLPRQFGEALGGLWDTRSRQYLDLRTAATLAYLKLAGRWPEAHDGAKLERVLNYVAHALCVVAPIRTRAGTTEGTLPQELGLLDQLEGRFERGASVLVRRDGSEVKELMIQRRDLDTAIAILAATDLGKILRERSLAAKQGH